MAFTKTPENNTYQTKQILLADEFSNRTGGVTKDLDFLNCFFETETGKVSQDKQTRVTKRAGAESFITAASTNVRGVHYWEDQNKVLVATDNDVTIYNSSTGALITTLSNIFGTTSGDVGFSEFLYDTNDVKVVITDGTTLGTVDTANTWVAGADADMPVPHLPQPVFLDGYLFLVKSGTADIYNSNLNDPLAYTVGDFISCEMFPDTALKFAKLNNYLLAFGSASIEYFWDAANASGSPLQRNDTPIKLLGFLGGFAQSGNQIIFVGNTSTSTPDIYILEDFKVTPIGTDTIRRYLESLSTTTAATIGNIVSFMGHEFYVLNVGTSTYVYDLKVKNWMRWAWKQQTSFALEHAVSIRANTTYSSLIYIDGESALAKMNSSVYADLGTNFTTRIVTDRQMFDTYNQKTMARLIIHGDRPSSDASVSLYWTDDDYQSYNTARTINLNQELPSTVRLGRFRRRAFKLEYTTNYPLRLISLEVDINMGQA